MLNISCTPWKLWLIYVLAIFGGPAFSYWSIRRFEKEAASLEEGIDTPFDDSKVAFRSVQVKNLPKNFSALDL